MFCGKVALAFLVPGLHDIVCVFGLSRCVCVCVCVCVCLRPVPSSTYGLCFMPVDYHSLNSCRASGPQGPDRNKLLSLMQGIKYTVS